MWQCVSGGVEARAFTTSRRDWEWSSADRCYPRCELGFHRAEAETKQFRSVLRCLSATLPLRRHLARRVHQCNPSGPDVTVVAVKDGREDRSILRFASKTTRTPLSLPLAASFGRMSGCVLILLDALHCFLS